MKKERKYEILEKLFLIENIVALKHRDLQRDFFPKLAQHVKFKDELEVRIECFERIFAKLSLRKIRDRAKEDKLFESIVDQFRERSSARALKQL